MMRRTPLPLTAMILTAMSLAVSPFAVMAQTPSAPPTSQPTSQPEAAKDVLNDMLKAAGADKIKPLQPILGNPIVDKTTVNPVAPGSRPLTLLREGNYLVDRTGRLNKTSDGQFELTFETDAQNMQDPPVLLLPNLKLMMMQDLRQNSSRDVKFRVTGMLTEYMGRNYLLLDKVVVVNDQ